MTKVFNWILAILTFFFLITDLLYIYFNSSLGRDKVPETINSSYVTTVTDPETGEKLPFIEANLYSNEAKNGKKLVEVKFNAYSGVDMLGIYSRGFQMFDDEIYYYDSYDGSSFESGHPYEWGDIMPVDIDGELFGVALDGKYEKIDKGKLAANLLIGPIVWAIDGFFNVEVEKNYSIKEFMELIERILKSNSNGTGESILPLVDMDTYMGVYTSENKKINKEDLGKYGISYSYFTMKANYSKSGALWSEQSMFNSIAGDSDYNDSNVENNKEYWKSNSIYTITENMFLNNDGYISLSSKEVENLNQISNLEIVIDIDLSNGKIDGFDYFALANLKNISEINISSDSPRIFWLKSSVLKGTGLTIEDIKTNKVTLFDYDNGGGV